MELPHRYVVSAAGGQHGHVTVTMEGVQPLESAPPRQFGGPGDRWSPETLLVAAIADCFILTFRAVAEASSFPWNDLHAEAEALLERVDRSMRFTRVTIRTRLVLPAGADAARARRLLEKAERSCLITSSLIAESTLECEVETVETV